MVSDRELFELRNGRVIMDEDLSEKMYIIKSYHPEKADETSSSFISIHAPREGSDSNIAQIFTIRTAILQHGYQTRLVFGTKSIVLNRKKSFKLPVFLREPTGLFMFTSGSRHGRSKNQRVGHIYGGACTDVLNLSLI